ncbi:MAG: hypothetical protein ABL907_25190 [Hyphomicrobium sp.]
MTESQHPAASHHLPWFITAPGESDALFTFATITVIATVLALGILFLRLHSLPERMGHKKFQFEIVAVLGLLSLFTHVHLFWVAGLLLALIDFPDFSTPLGRVANSLEKLAGTAPPVAAPVEPVAKAPEPVAKAPEPVANATVPIAKSAKHQPKQGG